ncbi:MAG: hypothetical protein U0525_03260 [Patescibacteria group bacterium]
MGERKKRGLTTKNLQIRDQFLRYESEMSKDSKGDIKINSQKWILHDSKNFYSFSHYGDEELNNIFEAVISSAKFGK